MNNPYMYADSPVNGAGIGAALGVALGGGGYALTKHWEKNEMNSFINENPVNLNHVTEASFEKPGFLARKFRGKRPGIKSTERTMSHEQFMEEYKTGSLRNIESKLTALNKGAFNAVHESGSNQVRKLMNLKDTTTSMNMDKKGRVIDRDHKDFRRVDYSSAGVRNRMKGVLREQMKEYDPVANHLGYSYDEKSGRYRPGSFLSESGWKQHQLHGKFYGTGLRKVASMAAPALIGGLIGSAFD